MPASRNDLQQFFDRLNIRTTTREHPAANTVEEAREHWRDIPGGHCKNLFLKDKKGALWLVVTLADARVDLKGLPKKIGSARLSFARAELMQEVLGIEPGSVTPFALINARPGSLNVILDKAMMEHDILNYHPLTNTATTSISRDDLLRFISACDFKPRILEVCPKEL